MNSAEIGIELPLNDNTVTSGLQSRDRLLREPILNLDRLTIPGVKPRRRHRLIQFHPMI